MTLYAFDGTWNLRDSKAVIDTVQSSRWGEDRSFRRVTLETNVHRFGEFYGENRVRYLQGVGTRFRWIGRVVGGASGAGAKYRLRRMYLALCGRYVDGDTDIDIVGFSRGAALAVHFAHVVKRYGVCDPKGSKHLGYHYYEGLGWTFRFPKLRDAENDAPCIRFLGLWDLVGSFGIPLGPFRNKSEAWWIKSIPANVKRSFHAMALDEVRRTFALVRPEPARAKGQHYEVWFRGVHSNIGGGYADRGLSDITLAWMMEMYLWTLDKLSVEKLDLPPNFVDALQRLTPESAPPAGWVGSRFETLEPDADGELGRPAEKRRLSWRDIPANALIHHSVYRRTDNLVLDHYRSNRRLLRQLPRDARPVYDPPFFYGDTPKKTAERVASEAFQHIPVRPSDWFKVGGAFVVRSDHWLAPGARRKDIVGALSRESFVAVATVWLLANKPAPAQLQISTPLTDASGTVVKSGPAIIWIVDVLRGLEPYVATLRRFRNE